MRISGHKTREVFGCYNIVNERNLKDAAWKLDRYVANESNDAKAKFFSIKKKRMAGRPGLEPG